MRYKVFGNRTGLVVSHLALGAGMFGTRWGYGANTTDSIAILRAFVEAGGNFIDTSDRYQEGESEEIVGQAISGIRNDVVLATKYMRPVARNATISTVGANRKAMVQAVEASLRRLKTDRIDVYFVHMDDLITPTEEIARGFDDLVRAGKILFPALSNFPAWRTARAVTLAEVRGWTPISGIQVEYNLLQRTTESEVLPMASALGLGVLAYSPLGGGLLTLKYRRGEQGRATALPAGTPNAGRNNEPILDALEKISAETNVPAAQIATAWVCAKGPITLAGPRTLAQLKDYLAAAELQLDRDHIARLDQASRVELGYPHELIHSAKERQLNTAGYIDRVDMPAKEAP
jgi:aryl-alcohol dehydrogenase-like predicted oxidoreductase